MYEISVKIRKKAKKNAFSSFFAFILFLYDVEIAAYSAFNPCCSISKLAQMKGPTPLASLSRIGSLM